MYIFSLKKEEKVVLTLGCSNFYENTVNSWYLYENGKNQPKKNKRENCQTIYWSLNIFCDVK